MFYLDIYTITHIELFNKKPTPFEILAGVCFIFSCFVLTFLFGCFISNNLYKIKNFLNQKIL
jgi:hypothetical protein